MTLTRLKPHGRFNVLRSGALCVLGAAALFGGLFAHADPLTPPPGGKAIKDAPAPTSARLAYALAAGDGRRYKVTAFFTGHFPPFAQENGKPIHLMAQMEYLMTVKKQEAKGTEVGFTVDTAMIHLLENDPSDDGKVDPKDDLGEFPITLAQIKQLLDVTALIKPNGSIVNVTGGGVSPIRVDLGFDLRKLFLTILPVIFPDTGLKVNDAWDFDDGVLGHKPGKTTYKAHLASIKTQDRNTIFEIGEDVSSLIENKVDREGNATDKPADAVGTLNGTMTASGTFKFVTPARGPLSASADPADVHTGLLKDGRMTMIALMKRILPDPEHPDKQEETKIDVKARLFVTQMERASGPQQKPANASGTKSSSSNPAAAAGAAKGDR
jgi:hypothetical protein